MRASLSPRTAFSPNTAAGAPPQSATTFPVRPIPAAAYPLQRQRPVSRLHSRQNDPPSATGGAPVAGNDAANALLLQPDGKILAAGYTAPVSKDFLLARYTANGQPDPSFGTAGVVTTTFGTDRDESIADLALQSDGKLIAIGTVSALSTCGTCSNATTGLARYLPNGTLDTTFGSGGRVQTDLGNPYASVGGGVLQSDGKIAVAGSSTANDLYQGTVLRYTTAGALDTTFGSGGIVRTAVGALTSGFADIAAAANGALVVGGGAVRSDFSRVFVLARYQTGALPSTATPTPPVGTATPTRTSVPPTATVTATPCLVSFSDVQSGDYFATPVQYLACRGIVSGYADGTFRPYMDTTRAQLAKIVVGAEGWPLVTPPTAHFRDVPVGSTFYALVETAWAHGILSGYSDGTFRPSDPLTRGQLSKIIVGAQGWAITTNGGPHFTDVAPADIFYGFVETARAHGILSGYSDGTFRPGHPATRGQIAKIVYGALQNP